ncbi:MAG: MJ1255/VC2487 family glycosyltransferase [Gammaproteobacteria bacterium]
MRIFYGIQGTGNGHITRGRAMATELAKSDYDVTYLFTGREREKLFEMEVFQTYQWREGLTFRTENGRVSYLKTTLACKPVTFVRDVRALDLSAYDLVISDFEPVTAWAAKLRGIPCIGLGHQYAFNYAIPKSGYDFISGQVMKYFAPTAFGIGLHWHHFEQPILPPIFEPVAEADAVCKDKIIVYLPFERPEKIIALLKPFTHFNFHVYSPVPLSCSEAHIQINPVSRSHFKKDFQDAGGIISNAGFELISESLQAGKKILIKPLHQQLEQISNALALQELKYGQAAYQLEQPIVEQWLYESRALRVSYPNVAAAVVEQLRYDRNALHDPDWIKQIWHGVSVMPVEL